MNPILPRQYFVPDVEGRVMPDGRMYLYGSLDISGSDTYCCKEMRCFSTDDMISWRDEGVIFRNDKEHPGFPAHPDVELYAPDAIYKDGKYYLFICCPGGFEGVAVGDSPCGPFSDAVPVVGADGDGIDPTVFVDDDGVAYYFWGQIHLKGGILSEDMTTLLPESIRDNIITEHEHGFHEGASIRKINGKYYMVYTDTTRGRATSMGYSVADHPLGPYTKCGIIIDNTGCDPQTWNDHGSIECFKGQWYLFYHRSTQNSQTNRRVCVEPITIDENGMISEVRQSSNGAEPPLDVRQTLDAAIAARMSWSSYIAPVDGREYVFCKGRFGSKAWLEFRTLDFGEGVSRLSVRVKGTGVLSANCESTILGTAEFACDDFEEISLPVASVSGHHTFWLLFEGQDITVDSFRFE